MNRSPSLSPVARATSIDYGRMVAMFGVILLHLAPSRSTQEESVSLFFLHFAVPYFFVTALFFYMRGATVEPARLRIPSFRRLLLPYAAWSAIYVSLRLIKHHLSNGAGSGLSEFDPVGVLFFGQASIQLYFLPMLFAFECVCFAGLQTAWKIRGDAPRKLPGVAGSMLWSSGIVALILVAQCGPGGFVRWILGCFLYLALASLLHATAAIHRTAWWRLLMVAGFVAAQVAHFHDWAPLVSSAFCGFCFAGLLFGMPLPAPGPLGATLLGTSYGVFLVHPVWIEALESFCPRVGFLIQPYALSIELLVAVIVFLASALTVIVVRRIPGCKLILFGE